MPEPATQSEPQDPVGLQFKVWCPVLPRRGHSLCLIGSLPELGSWDIAHALTAYPTKDSHTWRAEAHLPAHADFTWSWALVRADRPDTPQWEAEGRRRRRLQGYSGVIHSVWGQEEEVFLQAATSVQLTTHRPVDDGQRLVLSGSSPSTGRWDLKEAIAATEFPSNSGYWKAHVIFDAHDVLSFKWAVVDSKKPTVAVAEESLPHVLCGGGVWLAAVAPWDHEEVVVLQRDVTTERDGGRPDVIVAERKRREAEITKWLGTEVSPTKQIVSGKKVKQPSPQPAAISTSGKSKQPEKSEKPFSAEHPTREVKSPRQQARVPQTAKKQNIRKSSFFPRSPLLNAPYSDHTGKSLTQNAANINEAGYTSSGAHYLKGKGQTRVEKEITPEDLGHHVALMDVGHVLPRRPTDPGQKTDVKTQTTQGTKRSIDKSEKTGKSGTEKKYTPQDTGDQILAERISPGVKKLNAIERDVKKLSGVEKIPMVSEHEIGETPVIERDVSMVTSQPPTWSMMVEDDVARSRQPEILERPRKVRPGGGSHTSITSRAPPTMSRESLMTSQPRESLMTSQPRESLMTSKPRESLMTSQLRESPMIPQVRVPLMTSPGRASSLQTLGVPSRVSLGGSASVSSLQNGEPSGLGHDDFLKTTADIVEEKNHRRMWQLRRAELQVELEKKYSKGGEIRDKSGEIRDKGEVKRIAAKYNRNVTKEPAKMPTNPEVKVAKLVAKKKV